VTIRVKTPDGRIANFPDGMPASEIEAVLQKQFPVGATAALAGAETIGAAPWYAKPMIAGHGPSVLQALEALPSVGGMVGGLLGGGGGIPSGPGALATAAGGAAIGGAGGESLRQLIRRGIGASAPATSGEAAKDIGLAGLVQGGAEATGQVIGKGLQAGGQRLMHSALKPNPSMLKEYGTTAPKLVKTLFDEGINVTPGGMEKLQRLFDSTNAEIKEAVKNAAGTVSRDTVATRSLSTAGKLSEQVNPKAALRDVARVTEEFRTGGAMPVQGSGFTITPKTAAPLSIPEAQAMKIGTYRQIGKNYGKQSAANVETQKALARGLKEEIEFAIPQIKALNAREGGLMAAQEAVGHRVAIAGNRDPVGFAWVTHAPQTFLAALMDRSPVVKSMLARGMYASAGKAAGVSPQLIRAAVVAVASDGSDARPAPE
jgi:hypothetical protein